MQTIFIKVQNLQCSPIKIIVDYLPASCIVEARLANKNKLNQTDNMKTQTESLMATGDKLTMSDKQHVLSSYVHRFTGEHKPDWAHKLRPNGEAYPVQHATDADWLANTRFHVRTNGRLDHRFNNCESNPTWPFNPELQKLAA